MTENAQELFELIISKGGAIIEEFVHENRPENVFLDFKEKKSADGRKALSDDDKNNFAKALSGFANSSGGVLIWGVGEKRIDDSTVAYQKMPISNLSMFIKNLESLLPEAVVPDVDGVRNEAIKIEDDQDNGYVVTLVPESARPPHRAEFKLHQYYKRSGDSFRTMEHFDIEDMFGRRACPDLVLEIGHTTIAREQHFHRYSLTATVRNDGRAMSRYYGFDLQFPKLALDKVRSSRQGIRITNPERMRIKETINDLVVLSYKTGQKDPPIFPGEKVTILPNEEQPNSAGYVNYYVDSAIWSAFKNRDLSVAVYCDGAATKEFRISFSELNEF